jgi:hypothetical protein
LATLLNYDSVALMRFAVEAQQPTEWKKTCLVETASRATREYLATLDVAAFGAASDGPAASATALLSRRPNSTGDKGDNLFVIPDDERPFAFAFEMVNRLF